MVSSTRSAPSASGDVVAYRAGPAIDGETLTLRASTGPLAGLIVQAEWRGQRLTVRLFAPDNVMAARLGRDLRQMEATLGAALGMEIVMEVRGD
ncbi:hypothetical protein [Paraburkholderia sp. RL17-373-BIF-A]|uniref:hypothetical protein n=1 Tax=Paraburkholderia sp. RL17-373-BIF-A TaxID=3031629 RepID=UPI0038BDCB2D